MRHMVHDQKDSARIMIRRKSHGRVTVDKKDRKLLQEDPTITQMQRQGKNDWAGLNGGDVRGLP